jgi:hypothetical protein
MHGDGRALGMKRIGETVGVAGALICILGACWLRYVAVTARQLDIGVGVALVGLAVMAIGFGIAKQAKSKASVGSADT